MRLARFATIQQVKSGVTSIFRRTKSWANPKIARRSPIGNQRGPRRQARACPAGGLRIYNARIYDRGPGKRGSLASNPWRNGAMDRRDGSATRMAAAQRADSASPPEEYSRHRKVPGRV